MAERVARATILGLPTIEILYEDYISSGGADQDAIYALLSVKLPRKVVYRRRSARFPVMICAIL